MTNGNKSKYKVLRDSEKGKGGFTLIFRRRGRGNVNCVAKTYTAVNNNSEVGIYCRLQ